MSLHLYSLGKRADAGNPKGAVQAGLMEISLNWFAVCIAALGTSATTRSLLETCHRSLDHSLCGTGWRG